MEQVGEVKMVQILPQEPGLGELLGMGIGQGMQQGMQERTQQAAKAKQGQALGQILGLSPEESEILGNLPDTAIAQLVKAKMTPQQSIQPKLSPATTQYIKDIDKAAAPAQSVLSAANRLMELSGSTGIKGYLGKLPGPLVPGDIAEFESTINDLLAYYKAMFPRGITQQEFQILKKEALPNVTLSPEANKRRIQRFIDKANQIIDKQQKLVSVQERLGYIPENIRSEIEKPSEETSKESTKKFIFNGKPYNIPKSQIKEFLKENPGAKPQ